MLNRMGRVGEGVAMILCYSVVKQPSHVPNNILRCDGGSLDRDGRPSQKSPTGNGENNEFTDFLSI